MQACQERLYQTVDFLTSIYPYRNYKNIESLREASNYIKREFKKTGLHTSSQEWEVNENTYKNIIASFQPEKEKRFIVGAHYDVYKEQPGADDNASSVAGLLELARMLVGDKYNLEYGIDFVSFCLEEPPYFKKREMGSYVHATSVFENKQNVLGMIALEMIGYYREKTGEPQKLSSEKNYLIVSGIKKYDEFNKKLSRLLRENPEVIDSRRLSYGDNYRNNGPSDHRNYWFYGYPAAMVIGTGGKGNPHYHKPTDTIDTLDFTIMTAAVNSIAYALFNFKD